MLLTIGLLLASPGFAHPHYHSPAGPPTLDVSQLQPIRRAEPRPALRFDQLDEIRDESHSSVASPSPPPARRGSLPEGWTQIGDGVVPTPIAEGLSQVEPIPPAAFEDIPGNKYPRKHTLYLNFVGANLVDGHANDISAEDFSVLAGPSPFPAFTGGETAAVAIAQAVANDMAPYGVRVVYLERPDKLVPYTMEMMGGNWTNTSLDEPAGGVSPSADCGALNQRHVVFTFTEGVASLSRLANTASQEAAHAWGLDHTVNCGSVMSYCGSGDKAFSTACNTLCEEACQGANTITCRLQHESFCGEGSNQQNESAELNYLFGDDTPDIEPPVADIVSPDDGAVLPQGSDVDFRVVLDDDYGGMGWRITVDKDGEALFDEIDYFKDYLDNEGRAAVNLVNLEPGTYGFHVVAMDQADHVTEDSVTITVEERDDGPGTTGDEPEGSTGTDDPATTGTTGDEPATSGDDEPATSGDDDDDDDATDTDETADLGDEGDDGCGCQSSNSPRGGSWLPLLVALFAIRRRRPSAA